VLFLGACADSNTSPTAAEVTCESDATAITAIQGDGFYSPLADSRLTVRGTVTLVNADSGFYIEGPESDAKSRASNALFISDSEIARSVRPGQELQLVGRVTELGSRADKLTSLIEISDYLKCAENHELPLTRVSLPLDALSREALEGMRVSFQQLLTLTDVYNLAKGEMTLSSNGVLRVPTEQLKPGPAARRLEEENRNSSLVAILPGSATAMAVGSTSRQVTGVMSHNGRSQQLALETASEMTRPSVPLPETTENTSVRLVSSNLLNFFNGDGNGHGFPTERGAETVEAFRQQSARILASMKKMQPDLLAVQELENDGFGNQSAARSLLELLNESGHDDWAFIDHGPGRIGGDVITVGLFYRQQVLEPMGPSQLLASEPFQGLSRQPLAQAFRDIRTDKTFVVAVNHLKSKGSCPDSGPNADQNDGQGCWNRARLEAVEAELPWLEGIARESNSNSLLILGDMNSWRLEDPIRRFRESGLVDLVERFSGLPQYSFLYWGQTGTLDYAFASQKMAAYVKRAFIWHINADWPAGMDQPEPWLRTSDHDPVIVDVDFSQSRTSH